MRGWGGGGAGSGRKEETVRGEETVQKETVQSLALDLHFPDD